MVGSADEKDSSFEDGQHFLGTFVVGLEMAAGLANPNMQRGLPVISGVHPETGDWLRLQQDAKSLREILPEPFSFLPRYHGVNIAEFRQAQQSSVRGLNIFVRSGNSRYD